MQAIFRFFSVCFLFYFFPFFPGYSQPTSTVDSLQTVLKSSKEDTNKVILLNELAKKFMVKGEYEKTLSYSNEALQLSEKLKYKRGLASSSKNIGVIYWHKGNYPKALEYNLKMLKIGEEIKDKKIIASALNNIGLVYWSQGNNSKTLEYYSKSLEIKKEIGDKSGMGNTLLGIGSVYDNLGDTLKALEYFQEGLKLKREVNDQAGLAGALNNIGNIYGKQKKYSEALNSFLQSLKLREQIGDKKGIASSLNNIGAAYANLENYELAKKYLTESLNLSTEIGVKEGIKNSYKALAELHERMKEPEKAIEFYKLYSDLKDTLINNQNNKQIAQMQELYQSEKKDKEIILLNKDKALKEVEIQKKQTQQNALIIGLILFFVFSLLLIRGFRKIQKANEIIHIQKLLVDEKNKDIKDSINYAKRIQQSFLPAENEFAENFKDYFILNLPKDVVSGDFYWLENVYDKPGAPDSIKIPALAVVDCTGHGVPGALMSIVGNTLLNQTIKNPEVNTPADALNFLNRELPKNLKKRSSADVMRDGMDIVVCTFDINQGKVHFAGANNPIYIVSDNQLTILGGDKQPISSSEIELKKDFNNKTFDVKSGDCVYMFSDGYADQFGGPLGKKFKYKQFQELLKTNSTKNMSVQKEILEKSINDWKGNLEQVDDILIIGIRI